MPIILSVASFSVCKSLVLYIVLYFVLLTGVKKGKNQIIEHVTQLKQ